MRSSACAGSTTSMRNWTPRAPCSAPGCKVWSTRARWSGGPIRNMPTGRCTSSPRPAGRCGPPYMPSAPGAPGMPAATTGRGCSSGTRTVGSRPARAMSSRVGARKCDGIEQIWPAAPVVAALRQGHEPLLAAADHEQVHRLTEQPLLLAERVAAHLEQVAERGPLMIAVDDMQWADRVSRFVLRTLLARSVGLPIVLALAGREPAITSEMALPETDAVEHLSLDPLGFADVIAVARDRLGRMPDESTSRLLRTADGNPFLIMQLIEGPPGTAAPAAGFAGPGHNRLPPPHPSSPA